LRDLVSFDHKHNEANGEENRDGSEHNDSWNCGKEGPTVDPEVNALRARQQRNFLATLFLSQGVPMLLAGDEFGQTQHGNNNAYCQDSPIAWLHWKHTEEQHELLAFAKEVMRLRKAHPVFRRRLFFQGREIHGAQIKDIYWLKPDGTEMTDADWHSGCARALGMVLPGNQIKEMSEIGTRIVDDNFAVFFNANAESIDFHLGMRSRDIRWTCVFDTAATVPETRIFQHASIFPLQGHSLAVLRSETPAHSSI
jgi:isoamylase